MMIPLIPRDNVMDDDGSSGSGEVVVDDKVFGIFIIVCCGVMVSVFSCRALSARWYRGRRRKGNSKIRRDMEVQLDEYEPPPYSTK